MRRFIPVVVAALALALIPHIAFAHTGVGSTASFAAGVSHPLGGLDHVAVMVTVGLWAALKGGRALWAWPAVFVGVMLVGGALGMAGLALPLVEPAIFASVVALGLMVALAADLPVWLGGLVIAPFAIFHGHAHATEVPENAARFEYIAGFALATAALHLTGIGAALGLSRGGWRPLVRIAGAACVALGVALATGGL
jgi:urease accessory protein